MPCNFQLSPNSQHPEIPSIIVELIQAYYIYTNSSQPHIPTYAISIRLQRNLQRWLNRMLRSNEIDTNTWRAYTTALQQHIINDERFMNFMLHRTIAGPPERGNIWIQGPNNTICQWTPNPNPSPAA